MRILVFEPYYSGHRCEYLSHIMPALGELSDQVTLTMTREGVESYEFKSQLADFDCFQLDVIETTSIHPYSSKQFISFFRNAIRVNSPDHVFVPSGDAVVAWLGVRTLMGKREIPPGTEIETIFFSGSFGRFEASLMSRIRKAVAKFVIRRSSCDRIGFVDPYKFEMLCQGAKNLQSRSVVMPDPTVPPKKLDRREARETLGIPVEGFYLGCAGLISHRKAIDRLLRAFDTVHQQIRPDARLLLAGRFSPEIRVLVDREYQHLLESGRLIAIDRLLSPNEMGASIPAMDVVSAAYEVDGSSGIGIRAIYARRPILCAEAGWMAKTVEMLNAGITTDINDPKSFAESVRRCCEFSQAWNPNSRVEKFLQFHSIENFLSVYTARIRERLALPTQPSLAWGSVVGDELARHPALPVKSKQRE